jgi:hypothetical protein
VKIAKIILSTVFIAFLSISCGGNGDGGGGGGGGTPTGTVSQESIDDVVTLLTDNLTGCSVSPSVAAPSNAISVSKIITAVSAGMKSDSSGLSPSQQVGVPQEITGICETGSASFTLTSETETSAAGNVSFSQCGFPVDGSSGLIHGSLTFSGQASQSGALSVSASTTGSGISFTVPSEVDLDVSFDVSATVSDDQNTLNATITSFSVMDNINNEQFSLSNTTIMASGLNGTTLTLDASGQVTIPDGTFTFDTTTPLSIDTLNEQAQGVIQIDGANNSQIIVSLDLNDDIIINADTDGDGTDDVSETVNCSSLSFELPDIQLPL